MACDVCETAGGALLWQDESLRVVYIDEPGYAGYCRVIWRAHVQEMTDLDETERAHCMRIVFAVESVLRAQLAPDKINLASLGNYTPHVHWHVIPRFRDDPHFPDAIWAARRRNPGRAAEQNLPQRIAAALAKTLAHPR